MLEEGRISWLQVAFLLIVTRLFVITAYPAPFQTPPANHDVWLNAPGAMLIALLILLPLLILDRRFPGQTIVQYGVTLLGPAGKVIGLLYIWFFVQMSAVYLRQFTEVLVAVMPETPPLAFSIPMAILAVLAVRNGLEVIGRTAEFIAPVLLLTLTAFLVLLARDMDLKNMLPFMEKGFLTTLYGSFTIAVRYVEILFLAMVVPFLNIKKDLGKAALSGLVVVTFFFILVTVVVIALFGESEAKKLSFPFLSAIRLIDAYDFIERVEFIYLTSWFFGSFIGITLFYYMGVLGMAQFLGLKDYKPLVLPVGTIIVSLAILLFDNLTELNEFLSYKIWPPYGAVFLLFLPYLLLLVCVLSRRGRLSP